MVSPTPIPITRRPEELRDVCEEARRGGGRVAFVPTMGALHDGHLALVSEARRRGSFVVVSIFVNPTQFGVNDDFARYPRDLDGDLSTLRDRRVDAVFAPEATDMYPPGDQTRVRAGALSEPLCGPFRPGHFDGVATVVAKLLGIVGPCDAIFGRKDYQQLLIIQRMVRDFLLPVHVYDQPIVREPDGLAMSSRNAYLSLAERTRALSIVHGLDAAARRFGTGERNARALERIARAPIEASADSIDYVDVRDADTLGPVPDVMGDTAVLAVACRVGATRLIDNVVLGEDFPPLDAAGAYLGYLGAT